MTTETKQEVPVTTKGKEIQKATPVRALTPFDEMDRMFDRFMSGNWMRPFAWDRPLFKGLMEPLEWNLPRMDVIDRDADILVRAEVPGVDKKDIEVSLADNMLTVKGSVKREEKEEKGDYYRCETSQGAFLRTVAIPGQIDATKVAASLKDGVLEITLPKVEGSKRRSIKVE